MQTKKETETMKAEDYFNQLKDRFHYALFNINYDNPDSPDVFDLFNKQWVKIANLYNRKSKRVKVDPEAFYNYAIKQV